MALIIAPPPAWPAATLPLDTDLNRRIAGRLTGAILNDLSLQRGQERILLVNGFGGTVTSLEMARCSITDTALDAAALELWDALVHTAALRRGMQARPNRRTISAYKTVRQVAESRPNHIARYR